MTPAAWDGELRVSPTSGDVFGRVHAKGPPGEGARRAGEVTQAAGSRPAGSISPAPAPDASGLPCPDCSTGHAEDCEGCLDGLRPCEHCGDRPAVLEIGEGAYCAACEEDGLLVECQFALSQLVDHESARAAVRIVRERILAGMLRRP